MTFVCVRNCTLRVMKMLQAIMIKWISSGDRENFRFETQIMISEICKEIVSFYFVRSCRGVGYKADLVANSCTITETNQICGSLSWWLKYQDTFMIFVLKVCLVYCHGNKINDDKLCNVGAKYKVSDLFLTLNMLRVHSLNFGCVTNKLTHGLFVAYM